MFIIRTAFKTNSNGTGQVVARGLGKQRTIRWQHEHSRDWQHGTAAGTLLLALGHTDPDWPITHENQGAQGHLFTVQDVVVGS